MVKTSHDQRRRAFLAAVDVALGLFLRVPLAHSYLRTGDGSARTKRAPELPSPIQANRTPSGGGGKSTGLGPGCSCAFHSRSRGGARGGQGPLRRRGAAGALRR